MAKEFCWISIAAAENTFLVDTRFDDCRNLDNITKGVYAITAILPAAAVHVHTTQGLFCKSASI